MALQHVISAYQKRAGLKILRNENWKNFYNSIQPTPDMTTYQISLIQLCEQ